MSVVRAGDEDRRRERERERENGPRQMMQLSTGETTRWKKDHELDNGRAHATWAFSGLSGPGRSSLLGCFLGEAGFCFSSTLLVVWVLW